VSYYFEKTSYIKATFGIIKKKKNKKKNVRIKPFCFENHLLKATIFFTPLFISVLFVS